MRLFRRLMLYHFSGRYSSTRTPASSIRDTRSPSIFMPPTQSTITLTFTPARARSAKASANCWPISPDQYT